MNYHSERSRLLTEAKRYWRRKLPCPLSIAFRMMQVGMDVVTLENKHLNNN